MTTHALPSGRTAGLAVKHLLTIASAERFEVFDGEVDSERITFDPDEKVHGYAVIWAGAAPSILARLSRTPDRRNFSFQVTAAGGDRTRCLWVADIVIGALVGARLSIPDGVTTPIDMPDDLGPTQIDRAVNPPRNFVPLSFMCRLSKGV